MFPERLTHRFNIQLVETSSLCLQTIYSARHLAKPNCWRTLRQAVLSPSTSPPPPSSSSLQYSQKNQALDRFKVIISVEGTMCTSFKSLLYSP